MAASGRKTYQFQYPIVMASMSPRTKIAAAPVHQRAQNTHTNLSKVTTRSTRVPCGVGVNVPYITGKKEFR